MKNFLIVLGILLLLSVSALFLFFFFIPSQTASVFGAADGNLGMYQKIQLEVQLYFKRGVLTEPAVLNTNIVQEFQVQPGDSAIQISENLARADLVADEDSFLNYLIYKGYDRILQSGIYFLSPAQTPLEIAAAMLDPTPEDVDFVILPGLRLEEIAQLIPTSGLNFSSDDFLALIDSRAGLTLPAVFQDVPNLEGLLFAGKYEIQRDSSAVEFVQNLIDQTATQFTPEVIAAFSQQGLTPYQAITLASIIEREAVQDEEKPIIASVFLNRLSVNMALQSDPTAQYALGWDEQMQTWWKTPLTGTDISIISPYNTYIVNGLPPTPICSVSIDSLIAVAFPQQTDYFYFRSACDNSGYHVFAETYSEQQSNACP